MNVPPAVYDFWSEYRARCGRDRSSDFYEAFHFDDNEDDADALLGLVIAGRKRATGSLLWSYEAAKKPLPRPGHLSVVTTFAGVPCCVIETRTVDVVAYDAVTEDFAAREGEGDGTLAYWRRVHWQYFGRECERLGRVPHGSMPVVCEFFAVVHPVPE